MEYVRPSNTQPNLDNVSTYLLGIAAHSDFLSECPKNEAYRQYQLDNLIESMHEVVTLLSYRLDDDMDDKGIEQIDKNLHRQTTLAYEAAFAFVVEREGRDINKAIQRMRGAWSCVPNQNVSASTTVRQFRMAMSYLLADNDNWVNAYIDALYTLQNNIAPVTTFTDIQLLSDGYDQLDQEPRVQPRMAGIIRRNVFGSIVYTSADFEGDEVTLHEGIVQRNPTLDYGDGDVMRRLASQLTSDTSVHKGLSEFAGTKSLQDNIADITRFADATAAVRNAPDQRTAEELAREFTKSAEPERRRPNE